jgi:succinate dehydrogenase/fumarate reductase flavoprotein subunit
MSEEKEQPRRVSRRDFVKGAAAGAGALAGASALAGCGSSAGTSAASGLPEKWDDEADVVVVGTGFAGQATAIAADDAGVSVLMLEKAPEGEHGGNSRVCGQGFIAPSEAIWDEYFEYLKTATAGQGFPVPDEHLRFYLEESHKNIEWFESMGATVIDDSVAFGGMLAQGTWIPFYPYFPGAEAVASEPTWYTVGGDYEGPSSNWRFLEDVIKQRDGIRRRFDSPAKGLVQNPETKEILGVVVESGGEELYIKAKKAVCVCGGGWEYNQQMVRDFQGIAANYSMGSPYNTGETIKMCWAVGADIRNMSVIAAPAGLSAGLFPEYKATIPVSQSPSEGGTITVGANNKRWRDEYRAAAQGMQNKEKAQEEGAYTGTGQIIENGVLVRDKYPMPMHVIFDEKARLSGPLFGGWAGMGWAGVVEEYQASPDNSAELDRGWVVKADSISALAEAIGRDAGELQATVDRWNEMCEAGEDEDYGRTQNLTPIEDGPFYAIELYPACLNTQGGMLRNTKSQVVDIYGDVIPRLYSAGENGDIWTWVYQCMSNVGAGCYGYGRVAGENAAKEEPWG